MKQSSWSGKHILITGVCGTVGRQLLWETKERGIASVTGIDHNETELFLLHDAFRNDFSASFYMADVRDAAAMRERMHGIDIVLHAAACKHVVLCEQSPQEAVQTNIDGTQNVIDAALANGVERVLFMSSDKAVNPTNVMGTSKLMGERLMTAADANWHEGGTVFASTRFGNVLGSRGSVLPIFERQIASGGPLTLTDPDMTRFVMTLEDAVKLVVDSTMMAQGGEVFVTKMPVARIEDLAAVMIRNYAPLYGYQPEDIPIEIIGTKPGEKMYEELMNDEEVRRTEELEDFFVILPAFRDERTDVSYDYGGNSIKEPYNSKYLTALTPEELEEYLVSGDLIKKGDQ